MDRCHSRFQVFQCQIELVGIGLLGPAPEGCLLEGRYQLLKPFKSAASSMCFGVQIWL